MKNPKIIFSVFIITLLSFLVFSGLALADDEEECRNLANDDKNKVTCFGELITKYQKLLQAGQTQELTLKSQLGKIDTQTQLSQLKVEETNAQIAKLEREIGDLSGRITKLSSLVDTLSQVLLNRIIQTYKYGSYSTLDLLFSSHGFSDLLLKTKYLQVAQENDKKVLYQLQATKSTYNDQKVDKETRQTQEEKLKKDLERYQTQLADQKKAKQTLLTATKNDEAKFQAIIAQLKAEQESIARAISNIGAVVGPVTKGQQIASMGSTGCSTAPHLHFEVFENARVEGEKIVGNRANPHTYLNNGRLDSPISGWPSGNIEITADYGETYYVFGYPSVHTGVDFAPHPDEGVGRAIYAAENGIAYSTSSACGCYINDTCPLIKKGGSSVGKGIIIDHQNGLVTLYWHVL